MKNYDLKHLAFHILVGLYFIWIIVFCILLSLTLSNALSNGNADFTRMLLVWVFLNFIMGISIFMVLRLFRNKSLLGRIIPYSFGTVAVAALLSALFVVTRI
jgi:hypothetical protein